MSEPLPESLQQPKGYCVDHGTYTCPVCCSPCAKCVELKKRIENGRAAHLEDRTRLDWLARDRDEWKARSHRHSEDGDRLIADAARLRAALLSIAEHSRQRGYVEVAAIASATLETDT